MVNLELTRSKIICMLHNLNVIYFVDLEYKMIKLHTFWKR
jgi:hypothetical protein